MVGIAVRRLALPRLLAAGGAGLTVGAGALVVGFERIRIGTRVNAMSKLRLDAAGSGTITIGDECSLNDNVQISCGPCGAITLGEAALLGANVVLRNCNHRWRDPTRRIRDQGHDCADISIEDDVWIGANVVVLGGAHIREGSVIAAGSVVRRGVYGPRELYAGNPAVRVATRELQTS
jgi:virginiamycin A acetyltransferase